MLDIHALTAILIAGYGCDDLGGHGTCHLEALRALYELAVHDCAVVKHIPNVDKAAVEYRLEEIICVVEVDGALLMSLGDLLREEHSLGKIL